MPRDFLTERETSRAKLNEFTRNLPLLGAKEAEQGIRTSQGIQNKVLNTDYLAGASQKYGVPLEGAASAQVGEVTPELQRDAEAEAASRLLRYARQRVNLMYNTYLEQLIESGYDYDIAVNFARQGALTGIQEEFQKIQNQKSRQQAEKEQAIKEEYSQKGLDLMDQFEPQVNPADQIFKSLFSLGSTIATGKILTSGRNNANPLTVNPSGNYGGSGNTYADILNQKFNQEAVRPYTLDFGTRKYFKGG